MKNGLEGQLRSLIRWRVQQRDERFRGRLVEVAQEHNRRGILNSSHTVRAMHAELEREFEESAGECVKAAVDVMASRPTIFALLPQVQKVQRVCSDSLSERKATLEEILRGASASILASLSNSSFTAPYRSLSDALVQGQRERVRLELRTKTRDLFWLKLNRMLKLWPLLLLVGGLLSSYLARVEIAEVWNSLWDRVVGQAHASEDPEKTGGAMRDGRWAVGRSVEPVGDALAATTRGRTKFARTSCPTKDSAARFAGGDGQTGVNPLSVLEARAQPSWSPG